MRHLDSVGIVAEYLADIGVHDVGAVGKVNANLPTELHFLVVYE
jgi:hypothetical protein